MKFRGLIGIAAALGMLASPVMAASGSVASGAQSAKASGARLLQLTPDPRLKAKGSLNGPSAEEMKLGGGFGGLPVILLAVVALGVGIYFAVRSKSP